MATLDLTQAVPTRALATRDTGCDHDQNNARRMHGQLLVPATDCWYPPSVDMRDLLLVDFDVTSVPSNSSSLYLVEEWSGEQAVWRGCRRISRLNDTVKIDVSGEGEWRSLESLAGVGLRIVGAVLEVYKPSPATRQVAI